MLDWGLSGVERERGKGHYHFISLERCLDCEVLSY